MSSLPINGLDLTVGLVLLISALLAFLRGFVQETLSVGAWIGATFGSLYGVRYVQPYAREVIPLDWAADAAATVVLFLLILFVLSIATNMIARTVQRSSLNPLDRSLGFLFGLVRGAVILSVALIISDWLMKVDDRPQWMKTAKTLPLIEDGAAVLKGMIPQSFQHAENTTKDAAAKINEAADIKRTLERLMSPTLAGASDKEKAALLKDAAAKLNSDPAELKRMLEAAKSDPTTGPRLDDLIGQKMQELDAKGGADPSLVQRALAAAKADPALLQRALEAAKSDPGLVQRALEAAKADPALVQRALEAAKSDPALVQRALEAAKADPALAQRALEAAKSDPRTADAIREKLQELNAQGASNTGAK